MNSTDNLLSNGIISSSQSNPITINRSYYPASSISMNNTDNNMPPFLPSTEHDLSIQKAFSILQDTHNELLGFIGYIQYRNQIQYNNIILLLLDAHDICRSVTHSVFSRNHTMSLTYMAYDVLHQLGNTLQQPIFRNDYTCQAVSILCNKAIDVLFTLQVYVTSKNLELKHIELNKQTQTMLSNLNTSLHMMNINGEQQESRSN